MSTADRSDTVTARGLESYRRSFELLGALAAFAVGLDLYTRYSSYGTLSRDEAIYAYGGQQFAHGIPPYVSIFDPKNPLATMICGVAAWLAGVTGRDTLKTMRLAFLCCALLTVVAVYLLVLRLWRSVVAAVVAAVAFASFTGFAQDAFAGPDAKAPGILFAVVAMWLAVGRRWFWAAFAGGMAFLVWQPLVFFPFAAVVGAVVLSPHRRWRALAVSLSGAIAPVAAVALYFVAVGAFGRFIESAWLFPLTGVVRAKESLPDRYAHIAWVLYHYYRVSGALIAIGLALLVLMIVMTPVRAGAGWRAGLREPLVLIVGVTLIGELAYASYDFQSYPDMYPLLPYAAVGIGGAVAFVLRRARQPATLQGLAAGVLVAAFALTVFSARSFADSRANSHMVRAQRATACVLNRIVSPGTPLYSLGDPVPLVLTGRRNPDRFIYLESGVDRWKVTHTRGGLAGWAAQVRGSRASVIVVGGWNDGLRRRMDDELEKAGYRRGYLGQWWLFMTPRAYANLSAEGLATTPFPTVWPQTSDGLEFRQACGLLAMGEANE